MSVIESDEQRRAADRLAMRAWQVLGNRGQVRRWLGDPNALAGGDTPLHASATPEARRRLEQQLDWFAGTHRQPSGSIAVRWAGYDQV